MKEKRKRRRAIGFQIDLRTKIGKIAIERLGGLAQYRRLQSLMRREQLQRQNGGFTPKVNKRQRNEIVDALQRDGMLLLRIGNKNPSKVQIFRRGRFDVKFKGFNFCNPKIRQKAIKTRLTPAK